MKHSITRTFAASALSLLALATQLPAQTSAFTYQGALQQNGQPANGTYDFMFRLLDAETGGTAAPVIPINPGVGVTNGLFTTGINFDAENLNGANLWLEISVRTNGGGAFTTLAPRQLLTSAPYAVRAANVSASGISGTYGNAVMFNNAANSFYGSGAGLTALNATALTQGTVPPAALDNAWKIGGNAGTTAGAHFIGTTDNQPLELRVSGERALRLEDVGDSDDEDGQPDGAPNVILGSRINAVLAGAVGATISGGGATNHNGLPLANSIRSSFSSIGGGGENEIGFLSQFSVIGGGTKQGVYAPFGTIAGGFDNTASGAYGFVGGGELNGIHPGADYSAIAGGRQNLIENNSIASTISGGAGNRIEPLAESATISGGNLNTIVTGASFSLIAGGSANAIAGNATFNAIGGGGGNSISSDSEYNSIGGGLANSISMLSSHATIAGGNDNTIGTAGNGASIGGGYFNSIGAEATYSTIAGGLLNGSHSQGSVIGGGIGNFIGEGATNSVIAGGEQNQIGIGGSYSTIGGGYANTISAESYATVPGGALNQATSFGFAAGYRAKALHEGAFVWADSTDEDVHSAAPNSVTFRGSGGFRLFTNGDVTAGVSLAPNATAWSVISDRAVKKDFAAVDSRDVLEKLAAVPVQSWHYQWESADATPHLGPVAQDFKAAFYPGRDDKSITTLEFDGVALAAIQGLNRKLEAELQRRDVEDTELKQQNAELLKRLEAIEARLK